MKLEWTRREERRRFFRLRYPTNRRPRIEVNDGSGELVELSERGLRLAGWRPSCDGCALDAVRIHFDDGTVATLEDARVERVDGDQVILTFMDGVDLERMAYEQRRVIRASIVQKRPEHLSALRDSVSGD